MDANVVDAALMRSFPRGTRFIQVQPWAASGWTQTARVKTEIADGTLKDYFLKTCSEDFSEVMMKGEFLALEEMHSHMAGSCPKPHGWGEYESSPGTYFLVTDFLDLIAELPDPVKITSLMARLHEKTKGQSPNNMFGFHAPNCHGKIIQPNGWDPSWTSYFTKLLTMFFQADIDFNGPDAQYEEAFAITKQRVIPRLLDALTADGRELVPCLVHGDLWEGNLATNRETGEPVVFDPSPFYAHHEYELGMWRRRCIPLDIAYREQYLLRNPPSEPCDEVHDRIRLYSLLFNISHCAHWEGGADLTRPEVLEDMQYLNSKYASGVDLVHDISSVSVANGANGAAKGTVVDVIRFNVRNAQSPQRWR